MLTLLKENNPAYYNDFIYLDSRSRKCMYAEAKKAIYGTQEASLLFRTKLSKSPLKWAIRETSMIDMW